MNCITCGKPIISAKRSDSKFCTMQCKNKHHRNNEHTAWIKGNRSIIKAHLDAINKNREVIQALLDKDITNTSLSDLIMFGVTPGYATKIETSENMITHYFFEYYYSRYGNSYAVEIGVINTIL